MIDSAIAQTIEGIHASGRQLVFEFTGAGSLALAWLHSMPGSSRTILEATDRYSSGSLSELLGSPPEKSVDPQTAISMAHAAYLRACRLGDDDCLRIGVACTATIATDRTKRGDHRCCVAVHDSHGVTTRDLILIKGARDRNAEEQLVAQLLISAIAEAAGVSSPPIPLLANEEIRQQHSVATDPLELLWTGSARWVTIEPDGSRIVETPIQGCVYSGSFNPLHFGHEALAGAAERETGVPITFELPAVNADKAPLRRGELERRLEQFHRRRRVVVTRAPLFSDKASLFPGCTFVIGFDTAVRLLDPRFYGNTEAGRDDSLNALRAARCRVLVAGRLDAQTFRTLRDLSVPSFAKDVFIELPEAAFRADVSGTALRAMK